MNMIKYVFDLRPDDIESFYDILYPMTSGSLKIDYDDEYIMIKRISVS